MGARLSSGAKTAIVTHEENGTCSNESLCAMNDRALAAVSAGSSAIGVLVLPGSFNPVHSEHVRTLQFARDHLEKQGVTVVGGFLQPSSEEYVSEKLGAEWAMSLANRIATCELAAQATESLHQGEAWIYAWRSGQTNGFAVPRHVRNFLNDSILKSSAIESVGIEAYMVCGADLVLRCGGWSRPIDPPVVVVARSGSDLPSTPAAEGWHVAEGDTQPVSSTKIRDAIGNGQWEQLVEAGCDRSVVNFMKSLHDNRTLFMGER